MIKNNGETGRVNRIGKAQFREEEEFWNAYFITDSDHGDILIASVQAKIIKNSKEREKQFIDFVVESICDIIEDITGRRPSFSDPEIAKIHETTGHC